MEEEARGESIGQASLASLSPSVSDVLRSERGQRGGSSELRRLRRSSGGFVGIDLRRLEEASAAVFSTAIGVKGERYTGGFTGRFW